MNDFLTNILVLLSLGLFLSYVVISFLGLISYCSVPHSKEGDLFFKVFLVPLLVAISLVVFLGNFFFSNLSISRHLYLCIGLLLSLLPIGLIYFNSKFPLRSGRL